MTSVSAEFNQIWEVGNGKLPRAADLCTNACKALVRTNDSWSPAFRGDLFEPTGTDAIEVLSALSRVLSDSGQNLEDAGEAVRLIVLRYAAAEEYASSQVGLCEELLAALGQGGGPA